jgi:hypothetical protein
MSYQHKEDTGSLFKNDKRESDKHPHAKGSALIDGVDYWVSAWTNTRDSGEKYQSLKFSKKEENRAPNPAKQQAPVDEFEDEIPF